MRNQRKAGIKGITLIALVITIVVLIILTVISMNAIFGENGIISRVKDAASKDAAGRVEEEMKLKMLDVMLSGYTGNIEEVIETLKDFGLKGLYRINANIEESETRGNIRGEIDGVIESNGKLYRCTLIININVKFEQEDLDFDIQIADAEEITSIEDMARVIPLLIEEQINPESTTPEISIIAQHEYGIIVSYKGKGYQITGDQNINEEEMKMQIEIYIEEYVLPDVNEQKWKEICVATTRAYAVDYEGRIWL